MPYFSACSPPAFLYAFSDAEWNTLTADLTALLQEMLERMRKRDQWIAQADEAQGEAKIPFLAQAWVLLADAGLGNRYKDLQKEILQIDPKRTNAWTWRVSPDTKSWRKEKDRLLKE